MTAPLVTWDWLRNNHSEADVIALKRILSSVAKLPETREPTLLRSIATLPRTEGPKLMDIVGVTADGLAAASVVVLNHFSQPYPEVQECQSAVSAHPRLTANLRCDSSYG